MDLHSQVLVQYCSCFIAAFRRTNYLLLACRNRLFPNWHHRAHREWAPRWCRRQAFMECCLAEGGAKSLPSYLRLWPQTCEA